MRRLFGVGCALYAAAWVWAFVQLPPRVPIHFGLGGDVDSWAARGWALAAFALAGIVVAAVLGVGLQRVARDHLTWVNTPHKDWWLEAPERRDRFRAMVARDLSGISAATMVLLAGALVAVTTAAVAEEPTVPAWFPALTVAFVVGCVAWAVWSCTSRYRPDPAAE